MAVPLPPPTPFPIVGLPYLSSPIEKGSYEWWGWGSRGGRGAMSRCHRLYCNDLQCQPALNLVEVHPLHWDSHGHGDLLPMYRLSAVLSLGVPAVISPCHILWI